MANIPMNNLPEPHFEPSSLTIGVSGESKNAPYGPKAFDATTIEALKEYGNEFERNHKPK